ncbi:MAG: transposase [Pyrinomonadaceae bacterium]
MPHFEGGERAQFVTFRLHDSLPQALLERWRRELAHDEHRDVDAALRKRIEAYLDEGHGDAHLRDVRIARLTQDAMLYFDGVRYKLSAWVVMPNHVHLLATPRDGFTLSSIMHSIKSYTANEANKLIDRTDRFWQKESFDRYIRDAKHFAATVAYIENNPVKAGLCAAPHEWQFSSAYARRKAGSEAGSAGILPASVR